MAKRVFKAEFSADGIKDLQRQLEEYKNVTLHNLLKELISELAEVGITEASANVGVFGHYIGFKKEITDSSAGVKGIMVGFNSIPNIKRWVTLEGEQSAEISSILMAEFGSGASAKEHRGTFPNQTHAFEPVWYFNIDGTPEGWRSSKGIEPTKPMFNAWKKMYEDYLTVARRVFK